MLSDAFGQEGVEQCLSFHPNGLAVVQLAPTHPAVGDDDRQESRRAYCSTFRDLQISDVGEPVDRRVNYGCVGSVVFELSCTNSRALRVDNRKSRGL